MAEKEYYVVEFQTIHRDYASYPSMTKSFLSKDEKDDFVEELLADKDITSIEVGVYNKVK